MLRATCLCLIVSLSIVVCAQNPNSQNNFATQSSSAVQVVYVIDGATLPTYNVDPQALYATQVGTITLQESTYPTIVPSANDHFIYYRAYDDTSESAQHIWVYAT